MRKRCYYEILELSLTSTLGQIRHSYHKLARKWHPDKNKSEKAKAYFQELNEAYAILSDPEEKRFYDKHRETIVKNWNLGMGGFTTYNTDNSQTLVPKKGGVLPYFVRPAFLGYEDTEIGFYSVYRNVFDTVNTGVEEMNSLIYDHEEVDNIELPNKVIIRAPSFGDSETDLNDVVAFYSYWENLIACVEEEWMELCSEDTSENRALDLVTGVEDRRKMMRKYIEIIKSLIRFVRMQDPRYKRILENGIVLGLGYDGGDKSPKNNQKVEEENKSDNKSDEAHNETCQECWAWAASSLHHVLRTKEDELDGMNWQEGLPEPLEEGANGERKKESNWDFDFEDGKERRDIDQEVD